MKRLATTTTGRLAAFVVAIAVVAAAGWAIGAVAGPFSTPPAQADAGMAGHDESGSDDAAGGHDAEAAAHLPAGLTVSEQGYTLVPAATTLSLGANTFGFQIIGPDGAAVTAYDVEHEKRMHLVVVRRDTAQFQHIHPELGADGVWTVALPLPEAGSYRAFADFTPTGADNLTLGVDLVVPGEFQPQTYSPSRVANVDGYEVRLDGDLVAGQTAEVTLTVIRAGQPVTDLQPYLGAYGHLVALRGGDLGYLHVHPDGEPGDGTTPAGPQITFFAEVPSAGPYRLFLDFQHQDVVHTAEFTLDTADEDHQ